MKKILTSILWMLFSATVFAQSPQAVCYQAVATDAAGVELQARNITVLATILQGTINGNIVRQETHSVTTDEYGLFNLEIGQGQQTTGSPSFSDIDWGAGPFFLRMEMDQNGGSNYVLIGVSQILSVPYALYSEKSGTAQTAITAETAIYADTSSVALTALSAVNDGDTSDSNELQSLEYDAASGSLTLSDSPNGGVVINVNDADADPENEIQNLQYDPSASTLALTGSTAPAININTDDADADPDNEIQQLIFEDNSLTITGSGGNTIHFGSEAFGAPGASSDFPQGIVGEHMVLTSGTYTIPANKTFYLTAGGNTVGFVLNDGTNISHPNTPNMPVFGPNTVLNDCRCTGLLVDYDANIAPVVINLTETTDSYVVPNNFILFVKSGISNSMTGSLKINGQDMEFLRPNFTRGSRILSLPAGTEMKRPLNSDAGPFILTGYLISVSN